MRKVYQPMSKHIKN